MSSTYSPDLRIELIANGEQSGYWGTTTNNNLGTLIEDAISGLVTVSVLSANQAFTALNGAADEARSAVIKLFSVTSAAFNVYAPPVTKTYIIYNASNYAATIYASTVLGNTTAAGNGVTIPGGKTMQVRCDGTNFVTSIDSVATSMAVGTSASVGTSLTVGTDLTVGGDTVIGDRQSGTYIQNSTTVTVTITNHGYVNSEVVTFIPTSGLGQGGSYVITYINSDSFSFTSAVSQTVTTSNCIVTNDAITLNGVVTPGVIVEGSSTLPALRVTQTGSGAAILVEDSTNPDTTPFTVNASGNVGIGTTAPAQLLDITADSTVISQLSRYSTDTSAPASLIRKARGTLASPTIVSSGDTAGSVVFQAYDGAAFQSVAQIDAAVDGTPGAGDMPGRWVLSTTPDGSATLVERVRVDNAGNVIIGAGEASATTTGNTLRAPNRTGTNAAGANLVIAAGNGTGTGGSGYLSLQTANVGSTGTTANTMVDRLKIQTNGLMLGQYSTMGNGVVPSESIYRLNSAYAGSATTDAQKLFGVGIQLAANTVYTFEMMFVLLKTTGVTTTHNVSLAFDIGSGTVDNIGYEVLGRFQANQPDLTTITAPDSYQYIQTKDATAVTNNSGSYATVYYISRVVGTISVGTAGIWTPQYKTSVAVGPYSTQLGSFVKITPVGASGANTNVGGWA